MLVDGGSKAVPNYRLLTEKQISEIHSATLWILAEVGVKVLHPEGRRLMISAGCRPGNDAVVFVPENLVERSIRSAPSAVSVCDRKRREAMSLSGRNVYFGLGTDLPLTRDLSTGDLRRTILSDIRDAAVVGDALAEIDFVASCGLPRDVSPNLASVAVFKMLTAHSTKPVYFTAAGGEDMRFVVKMAETIAGSASNLREKPFLILYAEPTSPLVHSYGAVEKLLIAAQAGIPLNYVPAVMAGGTGPVTLAGAMALANAEALSGLVMHQLKAGGAPMISGFSVTPLDLAYGTTVYGSPEERLTHSACAELFRHYGLPMWGEAGCSDAKTLDEQAAAEAAVSILMAALDGVNLVHDVGYLGQGTIGSAAAVVMCGEFIAHAKRILRGIDFNAEAMALDVIRKVGPGGQFLGERHTARHFRTEHLRPKLFDRQSIDKWKADGAKTLAARATEKAREILATHAPEPLDPKVARQLDDLYREAEATLEGRYIRP